VVAAGGAWAAEPAGKAKSELQLKEGDVVALCGDSITSSGQYPAFMELYQLLCGPKMKVSFVNCGRWGETAGVFPKSWDKDFLPAKPTVVTICYGMNTGRGGRPIDENTVAGEAKALKVIIEKFREIGGRVVILGSPGCVDSEGHNAPAVANANLGKLRDGARKLAGETKSVFADVHTPMIEVMAKAKEKYGKDFAFAGGKGDGVHPGGAGHLVMAWAFLKALGFDGDIGTIMVDLAKDQATAAGDHQILSCKGGTVEVESTRYPYCFLGDPYKPGVSTNSNSTLSVFDLFAFNQDLNRYRLVVHGAKDKKLKVTWGTQSREFDAAALEKGINLAAEFPDNPFCKPFQKIWTAMRERNSCRGWLKDPKLKGIPERMEKAVANMVPVPVKHTIKIEPAP
jgi:lysophospholipase L1-like esterase